MPIYVDIYICIGVQAYRPTGIQVYRPTGACIIVPDRHGGVEVYKVAEA